MTKIEFPQSRCLIGVSRADVTPPVGIYHRMWGAAKHDKATGVHRPLTITDSGDVSRTLCRKINRIPSS